MTAAKGTKPTKPTKPTVRARPGSRSRGALPSRRSLPVALTAVVAVAAAALAVSVGLVVSDGGSSPSGASTAIAAPFSDPTAVGYIGLCDAAGQQVRSGNINTTPFAFRAVSSEAAPPPYDNDYRTAILLAYQPRPGLVSGEWSGSELTASTRYSNPDHPMAQATGGDDSLEDFISDFHPVWNGFIQLRMYLGTRDAEVYSVHYPQLAIQVTGDTWHAVGGGSVDCNAGTAESIESILLPKSKTSKSSATATTSGSTTGTTKAGSGPTTTSPGSATSPTSGGTGAAGGTTVPGGSSSGNDLAATGSSSNHVPLVIGAIALLVLVGAGAYLLGRRRRPIVPTTSAPTTSAPADSTTTKGPRQ